MNAHHYRESRKQMRGEEEEVVSGHVEPLMIAVIPVLVSLGVLDPRMGQGMLVDLCM